MTKIPHIPETAPFTPEQRAWLNGFLAGLYASAPPGQTPAVPLNGAPATSAEPLLVLFGSQSGSAEGLAKKMAKEFARRGFAPKVAALNDFESAGLATAQKAVIITSTWGEGDPPDNAANFWSWLKADAAPQLGHLQFAVLGLGDRNYSDFCGAAKKFDTRLESLGAKRFVPCGECDVDYEAAAASWMDGLLKKLGEPVPAGPPQPANGHVAPPDNGQVKPSEPQTGYGKKNPFPARLLKNVPLNKPGSAKEVRHYEISLEGSGLVYEAGDALGVMPVNCPELVNEVLAALRCRGDEPVAAAGKELPLREALARHFDITKPSQEFFATVANAARANDLAALLALEKSEELRKWLHGRGVIDLLMLLAEPLPPADFVKLLKKLSPRLYSISSSPKAHPGEVHLTVGAVRYHSFGRERKGVASTFLADRVGEADYVKVYIQPSHGFKPPANGDLPMIMVGPGTGIAPFRAFLEERQATGARGKNWLLFGDQKRDADFLYEDQVTKWRDDGHLTRLDLAFSRDQEEKIYVQHRMMENGPELWAWLEAGAHFYVCGDASRMARDVDAALRQVIQTSGGRTAEEAVAYVAKLKSERRYQRDVY